MSDPIITILGTNHIDPVTDWYVGEVKATQYSNILEVNIWNNKGGTNEVADIRDVTVTCLDGDGLNIGDIPLGKWMNVLVNSTADTDTGGQKVYSSIGGDQSRPLRGETVSASLGNIIKGTTNDGNPLNSGANYCNCKFKLLIPPNAKIETHKFKIEIEGFFV